MHDYFADWYREIDANPSPEKLELAWGAVESVAERAYERSSLLDLVELAFSKNAPEQIKETISKNIKEADSTFPMRDNEHALQVLAAASLIQRIKARGDDWLLAALATSNRSWTADIVTGVQDDLVTTSKNVLAEEAVAEREAALQREMPSTRELSTAIEDLKSLEFDNVVTSQAQIAQQNLDKLYEGLCAVLEIIPNNITAHARFSDQQPALRVLKEENNVLWWVFSEFSSEMDLPISEINKDAWNIYAAVELADRTTLLPAPDSMKAVLDKALFQRDKVRKQTSLEACVNACDTDWIEKFIKRLPAVLPERMAPIITALSSKRDGATGSNWSSVIKQRVDLDPTDKVSRRVLAWQLYQECLLMRVYQDV